jgi:hypothetical protein
VPFRTVPTDGWYATKDPTPLIDGMGEKEEKKTFHRPLKSNRRADDPGGEKPYRRVDELDRSEEELKKGKLIKTRGFPEDYKAKPFRVAVRFRRTEWIAANDLFLRIRRTRRERRAACAGRSRSFTERPRAANGDRGMAVPSGAHPGRPHSVRITGVESPEVPGFTEPGRPSTGSSTACYKTIPSNNSRILPFGWFLRKSYKANSDASVPTREPPSNGYLDASGVKTTRIMPE